MKKLITLLFILMASVFGMQAQDLNEILDTYFETIGQEEAMKHNSTLSTGKSVMQGMELPFTIMFKRPDKMRLEIDIQGAKIIQAYNGETGWYVNPMAGTTDAIEMSGIQLQEMERQADFDGMLYNYKEKGYTTEYIGTDEMEGTEIHKIKQTDKDGNEFFHYMDADNFVLLKTAAKLKIGESVTEVETLYSNYKEQDGMVMAYSMETRQGGQSISQIIIEEVVFDVEFDDPIFDMPEKAEVIEKLEEDSDKDEDK
ncbi:MAG: hypothetical protein K8S16_19810 [Bacteroidales bacterium]|nr:hypothetical protein [Bacteroidales bacterium]